jgi:hypothetical protein
MTDGMDDIERWRVESGWSRGWTVVDVGRRIPNPIAHCDRREDAERIVALHEQLRGAVEGLREIEAGEPLHRYEWCQAVARSTLAKIGPTYIKGP